MSYSRFNRHEHMSKETLYEIGDIINEVRWGNDTFNLTNSLYGLYDGYLYDELIGYADEVTMSKELYRRILKVFSIVSKYPKTEWVSDEPDAVTNEVEPMEYSEGMGVAEGKMYLASLEY